MKQSFIGSEEELFTIMKQVRTWDTWRTPEIMNVENGGHVSMDDGVRQMNRKQEFDRLWKWVRTYMYIEDGPGKNYFVWSCAVDGTRNADGRRRTEKNILQWRSFLLQRDGEMEKAFSITAARQERFYGNVFIRESQGIRESRCGIRKII